MFKYAKITIFILFFALGALFFVGNCSATKPVISNLSYFPSSPSAGERVTISFDLDVGGSRTEGTIRFGDEALPAAFDFIQCNSNCSISYAHSYSTEGSKTVNILVENIATGETNNASLSINISAGTGGTGGVGTGTGTGTGTGSGDNPMEVSTFGELLDKIIDVIFWLAIILLPIGIITGGIIFLTAAGNPSNIELGKKIILYCVVILGTIIMFKTLSFIFKDDLTFTK